MEIDAPCCHPRLLARTLNVHNLWDSTKFPMLDKFTDYPNEWRRCLAIADAKVELIRIFYGGRPKFEIPFLLKICDEVQKAATALLRTAQAQPLLDPCNDRPNPDFSRLSAFLSFEEAKLLELVHAKVGEHVNVLLYDGCYIRCNHMPTKIAILDACRACGAKHSFRCTWSPGLWSLMLYTWLRQHSEHQDAGGRSWRRSCRSNASPACTMRSPSCALAWTLAQLEKWTKMASSLPRTSTAMLCLRPKDQGSRLTACFTDLRSTSRAYGAWERSAYAIRRCLSAAIGRELRLTWGFKA